MDQEVAVGHVPAPELARILIIAKAGPDVRVVFVKALCRLVIYPAYLIALLDKVFPLLAEPQIFQRRKLLLRLTAVDEGPYDTDYR